MSFNVVMDHWEFMGPTFKKVVDQFDSRDAAEKKAAELNRTDPLVVDHDCGDDYDRKYVVVEA